MPDGNEGPGASQEKHKKLTVKQEKFLEAYVKHGFNGHKAAEIVGYHKEYASDLLKLPHVAARVEVLRKEIQKNTMVTAQMIADELRAIAFSKSTDSMQWTEDDVTFIPSNKISPEEASAISEVTVRRGKEGNTLGVRKHDKLKALELLGRHIGMFKDAAKDGTNDDTTKDALGRVQAAINRLERGRRGKS